MTTPDDAYSRYCLRRTIRNGLFGGLLTIFLLLFVRAVATSSGVLPHFLFFGFLSALTTAGYVFWSRSDPDPNPEETERLRKEKAAAAEVIAKERAAEKAEQKRIRDAEKEKQAAAFELQMQREKAVWAQQEALKEQQRQYAQRENRITELLILADTNMSKALKLATREGIDLHAEAQKRVNDGAAAVGAMAGEFLRRLAD